MCGLLSTCPPSTAGEKWGGMGGLSAGEVCSGCVGLCGGRLGAKLEGREGKMAPCTCPNPPASSGPARQGAWVLCVPAKRPNLPSLSQTHQSLPCFEGSATKSHLGQLGHLDRGSPGGGWCFRVLSRHCPACSSRRAAGCSIWYLHPNRWVRGQMPRLAAGDVEESLAAVWGSSRARGTPGEATPVPMAQCP